MPENVQNTSDPAKTQGKQSSTVSDTKPLWKKALNAVLYTTSALVAPVNFDWKKKKLSFAPGKVWVALGFAHFVVPMSGYLFPTADEYLVKNGFQEAEARAIVSNLAPERDVRVATDDWKGKAYVFAQQPLAFTLMGWNGRWGAMKQEEVSGFALPDEMRFIGTPGPDITVVKEAEIFKKHEAEGARRKLTLQEVTQFVALHEIRHISNENQALQVVLEQESDSTYHAVKTLAERSEDGAEVKNDYLSYLGDQFTATHDTVLYLDRKFNEQSMPPIADIKQANIDAADYMWANGGAIIASLKCQFNGGQVEYCNRTWHGLPDLSPLAARRVDIFVQSQKSRTDQLSKTLQASPRPPKGPVS